MQCVEFVVAGTSSDLGQMRDAFNDVCPTHSTNRTEANEAHTLASSAQPKMRPTRVAHIIFLFF